MWPLRPWRRPLWCADLAANNLRMRRRKRGRMKIMAPAAGDFVLGLAMLVLLQFAGRAKI